MIIHFAGVAFIAQFSVDAFGLFGDHWSIMCFILLSKVFALLFSVYSMLDIYMTKLIAQVSCGCRKNVLKEKLK